LIQFNNLVKTKAVAGTPKADNSIQPLHLLGSGFRVEHQNLMGTCLDITLNESETQ